jgi:hypothetical protein
MTPLERLQAWYVNQCNGDWEHGAGITISSIDNPGWSIRIDLRDTCLETQPFKRVQHERSAFDWLHAWRTGDEFCVACGPKNLEEALDLFCTWAGD